MQTIALLNQVTAPGPGAATKTFPSKRTFHAVGATTNGAGSATIDVEVSNDGIDYLVHDTFNLTLSTVPALAGAEFDAPWAFVRGNVKAISGTGAAITLIMGL